MLAFISIGSASLDELDDHARDTNQRLSLHDVVERITS
jgi:hypothetical protein